MSLLHNLDLFDLTVPIIIDDTHRTDETELVKQLNKKLNRKSLEVILDNKRSVILL